MRYVLCTDCGRKREPYRPIVRLVDGTVLFTCRQCWRDCGYMGGLTITPAGDTVRTPSYLYEELSDDDRAALRRYR